jgi:hypothetical protein
MADQEICQVADVNLVNTIVAGLWLTIQMRYRIGGIGWLATSLKYRMADNGTMQSWRWCLNLKRGVHLPQRISAVEARGRCQRRFKQRNR